MSEASADTDRAGPGKPGLSAKLLWLTILFVMIAEVLIYVPSVATFRLGWLSDRIASAQTAALVLEAAPDAMIPAALEQRVLESVGAVTISLRQGGKRRLLAFADMPADVTATYDLRVDDFPRAVLDAFTTLASPGPSLVRVIGGARARRMIRTPSSKSSSTPSRCARRCGFTPATSCCCRCSSRRSRRRWSTSRCTSRSCGR